MEVGQRLRRFNREHSQLESKPGKMLNSISHWGNAHLNHKEIPRETHRPARVKVESLQIPSVLEHWNNWKSHTCPVGMPNGAATVENSLSFLRSYTYVCLTYGPAIELLGIYPRVKKAYAHSEKLSMRVHWSFVCDSPKPETTTNVQQQKEEWVNTS